MMFSWSTFATLGVLTATVHWIIARSKIMQWLWGAQWLPNFLDQLLRCPACSGFWLGLGCGWLGIQPLHIGPPWLAVVAAGLAGIFTTPLTEAALLWGLKYSQVE
jgi:hypothetical protein